MPTLFGRTSPRRPHLRGGQDEHTHAIPLRPRPRSRGAVGQSYYPPTSEPRPHFWSNGPGEGRRDVCAGLRASTKRLNSDLRLPRVLEARVIRHRDRNGRTVGTGVPPAQDGSGELVVKVARNIEQTTLDAPDFVLSRSIAKTGGWKPGHPWSSVDRGGRSSLPGERPR